MAVTYVANTSNNASTGTMHSFFNATTPAGSAVVFMIINQTSLVDIGTPTDNNSDIITLVGSFSDANNNFFNLYTTVTKVSSTLEISVATNSVATAIMGIAFDGFVGTPTIDAALTSQEGDTTATTTISVSPVVNNFANEATVIMLVGGGTFGGASGWSSVAGSTNGIISRNIETLAGVNNPYSTTQASSVWSGIVTGIYDAPILGAPTLMGGICL